MCDISRVKRRGAHHCPGVEVRKGSADRGQAKKPGDWGDIVEAQLRSCFQPVQSACQISMFAVGDAASSGPPRCPHLMPSCFTSAFFSVGFAEDGSGTHDAL